MAALSNSPRLLKGAMVSVNLPDRTPSVIAFQYNPGTLTRTLQPKTTGENASRTDVPRFRGAPTETLSLEIELDAMDTSLATGSAGDLHPQLAALERLLYPPSATVIENRALLATGIIEVVPPPAPFTLFVFGQKRILPIRLTEFRVTEEMHDADLNPLQARITLGMQVLSYDDLPPDHPGASVFLAYQIAKEIDGDRSAVHALNAVTRSSARIL
jgi:hypothetical protein